MIGCSHTTIRLLRRMRCSERTRAYANVLILLEQARVIVESEHPKVSKVVLKEELMTAVCFCLREAHRRCYGSIV